MTVWILDYNDGSQRVTHRFNTTELLWAWLQRYVDEQHEYPKEMLIFKAECIFDGS